MGGREEKSVGAHQSVVSLEAALAWLPVASLVLADGSALAVNPAWTDLSGISEQDSLGHGWLDAIVPPERRALGTSLRVAAALGEAGTAECHVGTASAAGGTARWSWRPGPAGTLVVCVAATGGGQPALAVQRTRMTVDLASEVVHRLLGVGLLLQPASDDRDYPWAAKLQRAVDLVEDVIRDIRAVMFSGRDAPLEG